ncbi:TPA: choloylglycine hydrolase family protein [Enterococcus faecalis]|nr:choloylglycine hydrolase family protein [Enterococcus faecalis]
MCTGLSITNKHFYFGRNLDLECHFNERIVITPRNYLLTYKIEEEQATHFAMIGMANIIDGYPLYADAMNEHGLGMAGLNFPRYAQYSSNPEQNKFNVTPYEIIPWTLAQFKTVSEVKQAYRNLNLVSINFKEEVPIAPLHWIISDKENSIVLEMTSEGIKIFDNPIGVLTNNPTFDYHLINLKNYMGISAKQPSNNFSTNFSLEPLGQGVGGFGLPGDYSPTSRFIKASFLKENSSCATDEISNISQFFHILDAVAFVRGSVITPEGENDITIYSCCINGDTGDYYYKTYNNNQLSVVSMKKENLQASNLIQYELIDKQNIYKIN